MKSSVIDSSAVLVFLFKEHGHEKLLNLFDAASEKDKTLLISAPNWAEVRDVIQRKVGSGKWDEVRHKLLGLPIEIVSVDQHVAELAGEIKASHKMPLADCFAAALAKDRKLELYTRDPEFKAVESEVKIVWL